MEFGGNVEGNRKDGQMDRYGVKVKGEGKLKNVI